MSIEALAMAGADYAECEINLELGEYSPRLEQRPPPSYLLAEQKCSINMDHLMKKNSTADHKMLLRPVFDEGHLKAKIREWAKAVVLSTI